MTEPLAPVTPLPQLPMDKALVALLASVTKKPWEIMAIPTIADPADAQKRISVGAPFGILYPQWPVYSGPAFHSPDADVEWVYQATYVGLRGDQVQWGKDKITAAIVGRDAAGKYVYPLEVPGMYVMERSMREENSSSPADVSTELFQRAVRFAIKVTPFVQETP